MTAENRLDAMVASLGQVEPALDDLTRARVGAELQASLRDEKSRGVTAASSRNRRLWLAAGGVALAAAAAAAIVAIGSRTHDRDRAAEAPTATAPPTPAPSPAPAPRTLAPGAAIDVVPGTIERIVFGGADVTIYGPGHVRARDGASSTEHAAIVDADAALVDRSHGDGTWSLTYGDLEVRVMRATFALDRTVAPRVTVMRGELFLRCARDERVVHAGESATCEPAPVAPPPRRAEPRVPVDTDTPEAPAVATFDPYTEADRAMRRGDRPAARTALEAFVAAHPDDRESATALLDLARLVAPTDTSAARAYLDTLDAHPHAAIVAEPSAYLRCTLVADSDRAGRRACFADHYRRFPNTPRAASVLARLAVLEAATDCATAESLLVEYLARFPHGSDRAIVTAWRDRCARP